MAQDLDLDSILAFTIKLARDAGQMIRDGQAKRFETESGNDEKANSVDLVTEVDKAVEAFIYKRITDAYPEHKFIGEETYKGEAITDEPTWIVDPIDGTTNFVHGFPSVACSIGLAVKGQPVVGVIYAPFLDQLFSAANGKGAYLNEKVRLPITGKPKPLQSLGQALIAIEYGSSREAPALPAKIKTFEKLAAHTNSGGKMVHSLRSMGSAALNICAVATGGLDLYWEIGCWPWDVCAGFCILKEAGGGIFGGKTTELTGEPSAEIMASRKYLVIRGMPDKDGESGREAQIRFTKEFYEVAEEWDP
ncbi:hypothetical protein DB88DRAFT_494384 [Papiliotrema laurentii]|uniref:Inositol-1-monophosphatase n=1 Tax=Papiliotrema laurentii TaxID=5418 RepID=A0AAD9D1R5_PAPLA|nr:hypothetical protein DB88DRAFT_494384 [Papiliotrema laurentii]